MRELRVDGDVMGIFQRSHRWRCLPAASPWPLNSFTCSAVRRNGSRSILLMVALPLERTDRKVRGKCRRPGCHWSSPKRVSAGRRARPSAVRRRNFRGRQNRPVNSLRAKCLLLAELSPDRWLLRREADLTADRENVWIAVARNFLLVTRLPPQFRGYSFVGESVSSMAGNNPRTARGLRARREKNGSFSIGYLHGFWLQIYWPRKLSKAKPYALALARSNKPVTDGWARVPRA